MKAVPDAPGVVPATVRRPPKAGQLKIPLARVLPFLRRYCKARWYGLYHDATDFSKWGYELRQCRFIKRAGKELLERRFQRAVHYKSGIKLEQTRFLFATTGKGELLRAEFSFTKKGVGTGRVILRQAGAWRIIGYYVSGGQRTKTDTKRVPRPRRPRETLENGELALRAWLAEGKVKAGDGFYYREFDPTLDYDNKVSRGPFALDPYRRQPFFHVLAVAPRQGPGKTRTWYKVETLVIIGNPKKNVWDTHVRHLVDSQGDPLLLRSGDYRHRWETLTEARWMPESLYDQRSWLRATQKREYKDIELQALHRLDVNGKDITDDGLKNLIGLRLLDELNLNNTPIGDKGLLHLAKLPRLRILWLKGTMASPEGVAKLKQALPGCKVHYEPKKTATGAVVPSGNTVAQNLAAWLDSRNVRTTAKTVLDLGDLSLFKTKVSDADLARLLPLRQLWGLNLRRTQVTDEGLKKLLSFPALAHLDLRELDITNEGLKTLVPLAGKLTILSLEGTLITDAGLKHLSGFHKLKVLGLPVQISDAGKARIQKVLRKGQVNRESFASDVRKVEKVSPKHSAVTGCHWRLPVGSILAPVLLFFGLFGLLGLVARPGRLTDRLLRALALTPGRRMLLVLGVLALGLAGLSLSRPVSFLRKAKSTKGMVVQIRRTGMTGCMGCSVNPTQQGAARTTARTTYGNDFDSNYLAVRFQTNTGRRVTFQSRISGDNLHLQLGSLVDVRYDPSAPQRAMLTNWNAYFSLIFSTIVLGLMALALLSLGLVLVHRARASKGGDA